MDNFEQLAEKYSKMIHSIIHSLNIYKNHEEYFQTGLIALWDASKKFDENKGVFSTYAYSFIKGRILTLLRSERNREDRCLCQSELDFDLYSYDGTFLERETLLSYFHHLTEKQEKWVILRYQYGLTNREIAEREKVNYYTVREWQRSAMKKFTRLQIK